MSVSNAQGANVPIPSIAFAVGMMSITVALRAGKISIANCISKRIKGVITCVS